MEIKLFRLQWILGLVIIFTSFSAKATHNAAGEITYKQVDRFTYQFILTIYTEYCNGNADRPEATLSFGDGTEATSPREDDNDIIDNCFKRNVYKFNHTFPGFSDYIISYQDPNRNFNVINMTNSGGTPFYIECFLKIDPFLSFNTSPVLLLKPLDKAALKKLYLHNPNAYDVDGDSLSYKLVVPKQSVGTNVFNYSDPEADSFFGINEKSGEITWRTPQRIGLYNIAIMVEEWRFAPNGQRIKIGYIIRDMQIIVEDTENEPPSFVEFADTCIVAGTNLSRLVQANDPNNGDFIILTATGGPFEAVPEASFPQPVTGRDSVRQTFSWATDCDLVRREPYQVVFRAEDNGSIKLVGLKTWQIKIVGPAPENVSAEAIGNSIQIEWDSSTCDKVNGYNIYRRTGSFDFESKDCLTGVPANSGYELVGQVEGFNTTTFIDDNNGNGLFRGVSYCYRVTATYPDFDESYASAEACTLLKKDVPVITNVDIQTTELSGGEAFVEWSKPTELDTTQFNPPYEFRIHRSDAGGAFEEIAKSTSSTFAGLVDTSYTDLSLNSKEIQYAYKIELYATGTNGFDLIGTSQKATSIFLTAEGRDNSIKLVANISVPWVNDSMFVYRKNDVTGVFDSIGFSLSNIFTDTGLLNGTDYCYYVKTKGSYGTDGLKNPLFNKSQESCQVPVDTFPPCPPVLAVEPGCVAFSNSISWTNPNNSCSDDVVKYDLYYTPFEGEPFTLLQTFTPDTETDYIHSGLKESIAGCYYITATDSSKNNNGLGNTSDSSNVVCVDNCPLFGVPNVFSPTVIDGKNDIFKPYSDSLRFIRDVDFRVYSRWGDLVFKTTDREINWDGTHQTSGQLLSPGTYFYVAEINTIRVSGIKPKTIKGVIRIF
jgi:gliding motility-associated-like protein